MENTVILNRRVELLKELGIYDEVLKFVENLENTYSRFLDGDYSQIKRLP